MHNYIFSVRVEDSLVVEAANYNTYWCLMPALVPCVHLPGLLVCRLSFNPLHTVSHCIVFSDNGGGGWGSKNNKTQSKIVSVRNVLNYHFHYVNKLNLQSKTGYGPLVPLTASNQYISIL